MLAQNPELQVTEIEALRYNYLVNFDLQDVTYRCDVRTLSGLDSDSSSNFVLVLGELLFDDTLRVVSLALSATITLQPEISVVVREHPVSAGSLDTDASGFVVDNQTSLIELVGRSSMVVAGPFTNAALDVWCMGAPLVVVEDLSAVPASPLFEVEGAIFVRTPEELAAAIDAVLADPPPRVFRGHEYFYLDKELPRWRALLGLD
jgi:surface carbohydrate biosynthesis protein (TIGR04326 family)